MPCTRLQEIDVAAFAVDPRAPAWAEFRDHFPRCAECSREVARFATLSVALGSEGAGASAHPSDAKLLALARASSELARDERARLEAHLAGCAPCRTELAVARGFDFAAVSASPGRRSWLAGLGMALVPLLRRPVLAAAVIVVLAAPVAFLVWRLAREALPVASPTPPTAEVERSAPAAIVAEAQPKAEPEPLPAAPEKMPAAPAPAARPEPAQIAKQAPVAKPPAAAAQPLEPAAPAATPPEPPPPIQIAALVPTESPLYIPSPRASGPSVRVGGATRDLGAGVPAPEALAPAQVGASAGESPNLYWFLPTATASPVDVTVVDPDAADPLLETTIQGPLEAGVHRVSLSEHGARLRPGVEYRWFVALVRDPERRSEDVVSGAAIRYAPPGPELSARLSAAAPARAAHLYAESGFWYDAFDQLSSWLEADRSAALLRSHRAALLEQVGLDDAAAYERRNGSGE